MQLLFNLFSTSYLVGLFEIFILLRIIFDTTVCVLMTFYQWGHFVMLIIRNLNLISVQSWTSLQIVEGVLSTELQELKESKVI